MKKLQDKIFHGMWIILIGLSLLFTSCQKVEIPVSNVNDENKPPNHLYIVGRDDINGVICYGNMVRAGGGISCVKVK